MMKKNTPFSLSKILLVCLLSISGLQVIAQNSSPVDIPNLLVWLRADSLVTLGTGTQVAAWGDGGGDVADNLAQATATARPDLIANAGPLMNNKPVLRFSGTTDELVGGIIAGATDSSLSVYVIASSNAVGTNFPGLISMGAPNGGYLMYRVLTNPTQAYTVENGNNTTGRMQAAASSMPGVHPFRIYSTIKQSGVIHKLYINTDSVFASVTPAARGTFTNGAFRVGKTTGYGTWQGDIAEVIIFNRALTEQQRQVLENYIYNKYAPPVSLGPDISQTNNLCPITLRAGNRFASYLWSNGSTSDSISVTKSGDYWVRATNVFGKISTDTIHVTAAYSGMNTYDTILCKGSIVNLQPNLVPGTYTYLWSNNSTNATLTTSTAGTYRVTISDGVCQLVSDSVIVRVDTFPDVNLLPDDTTLCSGAFLSLYTISQPINQLVWSNNSTNQQIVINASGFYSVSVTNTNQCISIDTTNVTLSGVAPLVSFTGDTLCAGISYIPINTSASQDTSTITNYSWSFGDGGTSTIASPAYQYAQGGVYQVSLTATTSVGCAASAVKQVLVYNNPVAAIGNVALSCIQVPYQFTDNSTPVIGASIIQWQWNFGDNTTSGVQNPSHPYTSPNTYSISLIVTDSHGCFDTANSTIQVVSSVSLPVNATLLSPTNNIVLANSNVVFKWQGFAANSYKVVISGTPSFSNYTSYSTLLDSVTVALASGQTYYWKVHSYSACLDSVESSTRSFTIFSPTDQAGLTLWLKADSLVGLSGSQVASWGDGGGTVADNVSQSTATLRPDFIANSGPLTNYKPTLRFLANDLLQGGTLNGIGDSSLSIYIVASNLGQSNPFPGLITIGNASSGFTIYKSSSVFALTVDNTSSGRAQAPSGTFINDPYPFRLYSAIKQYNVSLKAYINSDSVANAAGTTATRGFTNGDYIIGKTLGYGTWSGDISEVLIYKKALTAVERANVEGYIYSKYAPPVDLGADIKVDYRLCPVVINAGPRFVNYLWSTGDTTQQISVHTAGNYWVRAIDVFGNASYDTINVKLPFAGMNAYDTVLCLGNSAEIKPILTNGPYYFSWNTGATSQAITVSSPGSYALTISDDSSCVIITDTVHVRVDSISLISLLPADTLTCVGNLLAIDSNGYSIANVNWSTSATTPVIQIGPAGTYTVTVVDVNQCSVSDAINVTIKGTAPVVNFGVDNVCLHYTSVFTDSSAASAPDNLVQWQWDFGDTNTSAIQNPNHIYALPGVYPVTLSVSTDSGCSASVTKYTEVYALPSANFTQLAPICANSAATLSDVSNAPVGTSIVDWKWILNGTTVSIQQNASVTFTQQGINPLTLVVTTAQGCSDTIVKNVEAFPALLADFEVANVCVGDSSYFFDITPSYSVISRTWSFGDGGAGSTLKNPVRKYAQPGVYPVLLTIRNAIGCQDTVRKLVTAASKPIARFGNLTGCEDAFYTPLDSSTSAQEPINSWQWTIGGFNYNTQSPNRYFATPGTYPVNLKVATETGCSDSITITVTIYPRPVANFSYTPLYGEAPMNVTFTNLSTNATTYLWQFGDNENSSLVNPVHTYNENGTYSVSLTAVSQFGCTNTRTKPYTAIPTDLDLSVDEASVVVTPLPDGSSLAQVVVQGSNISTGIISHIQFYVSMGGVGVLAEDWIGTLYTGQILQHTFAAKFVVPAGKGDSYICVTAMSVNNGETELRTDNNEQCIGTTEGIQLMGPLPNPALNQSVLGIILPKHGKVTIDIADVMGHYLVMGEELELPEGRSDYNLPVGQMTAGEYFIRISYNDEKVVRKLVIRR